MPGENSPIYLISKGEVRLEMTNNPVSKIVYQNEFDMDSKAVEATHDTATGMGNLSRTVNRA